MSTQNSNKIRELTLQEQNLISGGDALSSGIEGAALGGGLGGWGGVMSAAAAGVRGARWGVIGGFGGAALGFGLGVASYYFWS